MSDGFDLRKVRSTISDYRGTAKPANEFHVWIAGEHRATWKPLTYKRGYWLQRADGYGGVRRPGKNHQTIEAASQSEMQTATDAVIAYIPTAANYAADKIAREERGRQEAEAKRAEERLRRKRDAAEDLFDALVYVRRFVKPEDVDVAFLDAAIAKATLPEPPKPE